MSGCSSAGRGSRGRGGRVGVGQGESSRGVGIGGGPGGVGGRGGSGVSGRCVGGGGGSDVGGRGVGGGVGRGVGIVGGLGGVGGSGVGGRGVGGEGGRGVGARGDQGDNSQVVSTPPGGSCNSGIQGDNVADDGHDNQEHESNGIDGNEDQKVSHGGRGSNVMHQPPSNPSLRTPLFITKDGHRFSDYGDAGREITSILKNMYNGFWPTWSTVPNEEKDRLFDRFKMFFTWDPEIEVFIRDVWSKHNARRLCDSLSYARKIAIAKARSLGMEVGNDYTSIIPFNPTWIKQTFWRRLVEEHWNLEKWQSLSSSNSSNRAHLIEGLHTIGSAGYDICRRRFEADRGGPQPSADFFVYSHAKKGTRPGEGGEGSLSGPVFVDERARRTVENYKEYLIEKFAPEEPPRHDQECWERAVGKRKKGASYGSGKSKDPEYFLTGKLSGPLPSAFRGSQSEIQRL